MRYLEAENTSSIYFNGFSDKINQSFMADKHMECDCCGAKAVVKNADVNVINAPIDPEDARLFVCMVCGDTWIRQEIEKDGIIQLKFIYQITLDKKLERIGEVKSTEFHQGYGEITDWRYLYNGMNVSERQWKILLDQRRSLLKSIALN